MIFQFTRRHPGRLPKAAAIGIGEDQKVRAQEFLNPLCAVGKQPAFST